MKLPAERNEQRRRQKSYVWTAAIYAAAAGAVLGLNLLIRPGRSIAGIDLIAAGCGMVGAALLGLADAYLSRRADARRHPATKDDRKRGPWDG